MNKDIFVVSLNI